jgi:hypothetical protein
VPFLRVPVGLAEAWRVRLGPKVHPRVGIVCSGNPWNPRDRWRSIPAKEFTPLFTLRNVEFHLLQTDIRASNRDCLAALPNLRTHAAALTDLAETDALSMNMDLIVTVCTVSAQGDSVLYPLDKSAVAERALGDSSCCVNRPEGFADVVKVG